MSEHMPIWTLQQAAISALKIPGRGIVEASNSKISPKDA
jgi:hypothetical protein